MSLLWCSQLCTSRYTHAPKHSSNDKANDMFFCSVSSASRQRPQCRRTLVVIGWFVANASWRQFKWPWLSGCSLSGVSSVVPRSFDWNTQRVRSNLYQSLHHNTPSDTTGTVYPSLPHSTQSPLTPLLRQAQVMMKSLLRQAKPKLIASMLCAHVMVIRRFFRQLMQ